MNLFRGFFRCFIVWFGLGITSFFFLETGLLGAKKFLAPLSAMTTSCQSHRYNRSILVNGSCPCNICPWRRSDQPLGSVDVLAKHHIGTPGPPTLESQTDSALWSIDQANPNSVFPIGQFDIFPIWWSLFAHPRYGSTGVANFLRTNIVNQFFLELLGLAYSPWWRIRDVQDSFKGRPSATCMT